MRGGNIMGKQNWIPHVLLVFFNILILLSVWFTYADSHGLLNTSATTDGTFSNIVILVVFCISFFLALAPYGFGVLVLSIIRYCSARKTAKRESKPRIRYMIVALPALAFTLATKYLFLMSIVAEILYPDSFHI